MQVDPGAARAAQGGAPLVLVRSVTKRYPTGTIALAPIDLAVQRGEFVTLLGPSGCGKTTLLNIVAGLIRPSSGRVQLEAPGARDDASAARVAYVFQSPTLMPWARVQANVRLPLDLAGMPRERAQAKVDDALRLVGLASFARHFPRELSGGMQMRASIARALAIDPELLLMDEPFGALDEFARQRLDDELLSLWSARQLTVLFVTHSIAEAVYLSTRVIVMGARPGRILTEVAIDAPHPRSDDFRTSTEFARYAQRISARIREAGEAALDHAR